MQNYLTVREVCGGWSAEKQSTYGTLVLQELWNYAEMEVGEGFGFKIFGT